MPAALTIHFLNVDHGDSAVIEYRSDAGVVFGLVDSNFGPRRQPKALEKLRELGVTELSFVCLTHPHRDHYSGLYPVLEHYRNNIGHFYLFPVGDLFRSKQKLQAYARQYLTLARSTDHEQSKRSAEEFLQILCFLDSSLPADRRIECGGELNRLGPPGFADVEIYSVLPPNRTRGEFMQMVRTASPELVEAIHLNDLSIAIIMRYRGHQILLGGDGTAANWANHRRFQRNANLSLRSSVVKLPHHGSRQDCAPAVLENLFLMEGDRVGVVSANGRSHPHLEVVRWMADHGVKPYCTNLIPACGAKVTGLIQAPGLDPTLRKYLQEIAEQELVTQPCQGDISVTIDDSGATTVKRQHEAPCQFRGDFEALGLS